MEKGNTCQLISTFHTSNPFAQFFSHHPKNLLSQRQVRTPRWFLLQIRRLSQRVHIGALSGVQLQCHMQEVLLFVAQRLDAIDGGVNVVGSEMEQRQWRIAQA